MTNMASPDRGLKKNLGRPCFSILPMPHQNTEWRARSNTARFPTSAAGCGWHAHRCASSSAAFDQRSSHGTGQKGKHHIHVQRPAAATSNRWELYSCHRFLNRFQFSEPSQTVSNMFRDFRIISNESASGHTAWAGHVSPSYQCLTKTQSGGRG